MTTTTRLTQPLPGFRPVPRTGVIYVMTEAAKHGYKAGDPAWANLGQGAPETGPLPGSPARTTTFSINDDEHEYAPVDGLVELRQAVADLYNARFRAGKKSKYSYENVSISSGGRAALTRAVSTLGRTNVGHLLPDYTAYEELLDAFGTFASIPITLDPERGYRLTLDELKREILGRGLSAVLFSNPTNPMGTVVAGEDLRNTVELATELGCSLILDEFYSHYIYDVADRAVSAAEYVNDVNRDPIVIVDGLTKNWRYPGWRVSWTLAPKGIIESIASAGSFLDGGCARPMQLAALNFVKQDIADQEAKAIREVFRKKRDYLCDSLEALGMKVVPRPAGAFYCWTDLRALPEPLNSGMGLFQKALEAHTIVVPGEFFDINPGQRRQNRPSAYQGYARISFGPSMQVLERGVQALTKMIRG